MGLPEGDAMASEAKATTNGFWDDAEVISVYTREQALEDGVLVDVTEWASSDRGFIGGFTCPVAMTRSLWDVVDIDAKPVSKRGVQSTRGRAHDVLFMASLAVRAYQRRHPQAEEMDCLFDVLLTNGRAKRARVRISFRPSEGFTIGMPEDF